jgi:hypothetical protein
MNADQKKKEEARIGSVPLFLAISSDLFAGYPDSNSYVRAQNAGSSTRNHNLWARNSGKQIPRGLKPARNDKA